MVNGIPNQAWEISSYKKAISGQEESVSVLNGL